MTVLDVAQLDVKPKVVRNWIEAGRLKAERLPMRKYDLFDTFRIDQAEYERFAERRSDRIHQLTK